MNTNNDSIGIKNSAKHQKTKNNYENICNSQQNATQENRNLFYIK